MTELQRLRFAYLVGAYPSGGDGKECQQNLEELERLCETYGLESVGKALCAVKKFDAATFLGKGKIQEIKKDAEDLQAEIIIFDDEISPHQQKNLEVIFGKPVIDRTELIIEVFAQRAHTKEACLQIELARVKYQFPRLKRLWTHLSRQTSGGAGFTKGEGEKQIELDRRMLRQKVRRLEEAIEAVRAHRETQRSSRIRLGIPTFAIVGYTNAGKSTLLRQLTGADILVENKLFATLDTTARKFLLPNKQEIILIDTVGFIRKLPHQLVAAFRSTLEEVTHTDILLHLIDASAPNAEMQAIATYDVLKELRAEKHPIVTVLNKIDMVQSPLILHKLRILYPKTVAISAIHGTGLDELMEKMIAELSAMRKLVRLRIPQSHYALVSELMREGKVYCSEYEENDILMEVEISRRLEHKVQPFLF